LQSADPTNRQTLDVWKAKQRATIHTIHAKFIDPEVIVTLPDTWTAGEAKEKVDSLCGDGIYDELSFDPNNQERIHIPWTEKDVKAMVAKVLTAYTKVMNDYTKGTGGGDGDPVAYALWDQREPLAVVGYAMKNRAVNKAYLTVVHIWDKEYGFPLVKVKGSVPLQIAVDDGDGGNDNDGNTLATLAPPSTGKASRNSTESQLLVQAMNANSAAARKNMEQITTAFTTAMTRAAQTNETDEISAVQKKIEHTSSQVRTFEDELPRLKEKKREAKAAAQSPTASPRRKKKYLRLKEDVSIKEGLVCEYKTSLKGYLGQLKKLNAESKSNNEGEEENEDDIEFSDSSDSD
jgi:hypothetical protein